MFSGENHLIVLSFLNHVSCLRIYRRVLDCICLMASSRVISPSKYAKSSL